MPKATLLCALLVLVSSVGTAFADDVRPVAGPVILARSGVQATYLWDASPYVAKLVGDKDVGDAGLRTLEGTAVAVLRDKARTSRSKTLVLRVVYTRSGEVSPVYGTLTFNGVENLATLTAARDAIVKFGAAWNGEIAHGTTPANLKIAITGKLPPPQ